MWMVLRGGVVCWGGLTRLGSSVTGEQRITLTRGDEFPVALQTHGTSLPALLLLDSTQAFASAGNIFSCLVPKLFGGDFCGLGDSGKGPLLSFPRVLYTFPDTTMGATLTSPPVSGFVRPNDTVTGLWSLAL